MCLALLDDLLQHSRSLLAHGVEAAFPTAVAVAAADAARGVHQGDPLRSFVAIIIFVHVSRLTVSAKIVGRVVVLRSPAWSCCIKLGCGIRELWWSCWSYKKETFQSQLWLSC